VNFAEAVAARRSIRAFEERSVDRPILEEAVALAVQAPAPHHSAPWRFALLDDAATKQRFSRAMGDRWREDLRGDGMDESRVERIIGRSHRMLTETPVLVVCCADMSQAHSYPDERRQLAEWSLFAHSTGAALQNLMTSLATRGVATCWISAPVFCRDVVRSFLGLDEKVEPQALVLVGYPAPDYEPRPRPPSDPAPFIIPSPTQ
jgi:coenzyme F420-0:L-glutamate ligase/coenzyme F420-1:gamma-L-glutamate ligase